MRSFFSRNKNTLYYAVAMAGLLFAMRWLELRLLVSSHAYEVYTGAIALIFTLLGLWIAIALTKGKTKTVFLEKPVSQSGFVFNQAEFQRLNISPRQLEVLKLMASGLSNAEIAERLFLSPNTIKTHAANLFEKLDARRRTQAVEKAKQLGLIR